MVFIGYNIKAIRLISLPQSVKHQIGEAFLKA